jgi:hypothetical protein
MTAVARANGADRHRRRLCVAVAIAAIPILAGCGGSTGERDFCTQYADLVKAADQMKQEDPLNAEAGELRAAADDFQAELDQFQAVSEGRLDTALTTLRDDIDAVRQAALDARGEALKTARPLLQDAMDDVSRAWVVVQDIATLECEAA